MTVARKLLSIVVVSTSLVTILAVTGLYFYCKDKLLDKESMALQVETNANITNAFRPVRMEVTRLNFLSQLLQKELSAPPEASEVKLFDQMMQRSVDGAWRSKSNAKDSAQSAGVFLPPDAKLDAKQKSLHVRSKKTIDAAAFGFNSYFSNLWLITRDKTEVISDKLAPDFYLKMPANTDYTETTWMILGNTATNPLREMRWTEPSYDPVPKIWLISAVKPVDVNGVWIGNIGQDMYLSQMFAVLFKKNERYQGELHFLLDEHGNYLHAGLWQKALEVNPANFRPDFSQAPLLEKLFEQKIDDKAHVFEQQVGIKGQKYLAISTMVAPMGWRYFRLVPVQQILLPMQKLFYSLATMVLAAGLLTGFLINLSVRRNIVNRLQNLADTVHRYGAGELNVRAELAGDDEITKTAQEFDVMAGQIQTREHQLKTVIDNIPGIVSQVDNNLRYLCRYL